MNLTTVVRILAIPFLIGLWLIAGLTFDRGYELSGLSAMLFASISTVCLIMDYVFKAALQDGITVEYERSKKALNSTIPKLTDRIGDAVNDGAGFYEVVYYNNELPDYVDYRLFGLSYIDVLKYVNDECPVNSRDIPFNSGAFEDSLKIERYAEPKTFKIS